jgi:glycosyltransferase involved in cell wall biosynthesis
MLGRIWLKQLISFTNKPVMLPKNTALIHDWLVSWGGAEQVLLEIAGLFSTPPIYTALYQPKELPSSLTQMKVHSSFLQKWPLAQQRHRLFLPLMPLAFESFDLTAFDLVISSSHACAKGIIPGPRTCHLAYIHTPIRYAWDMLHTYFAQEQPSSLKRAIMHPLLHYLRNWDLLSNTRIDAMACNSRFVQQRIRRYYGREAEVIHPPVTIPNAPPQRKVDDFYLLVSRAVPYKRLDLAVAAFRESGRKLVVVGEGPDSASLKAQASPNISFLGWVARPQLEALYLSAKALIFPGLEDFGIVPVEAQAFGCPVIAFGQGGVLDSVRPEETGLFFEAQTTHSLNQAVARCEKQDFDPQILYQHAQGFSQANFQARFSTFVEKHYSAFKAGL